MVSNQMKFNAIKRNRKKEGKKKKKAIYQQTMTAMQKAKEIAIIILYCFCMG